MVFLVSCLLFFAGCAGEQLNAKKTSTTSAAVATSSTQPAQPTTTRSTTTTLPRSDLVTGLTSEGFIAKYKDYSFKIERFIYSADYKITGMVVDVRNPAGTIVQVYATQMSDGMANDLVIRFAPEYAVDDGKTQKGAIYVSQRDVP